MTAQMHANYRLYSLPLSRGGAQDRVFRKYLNAGLLLWLVLIIAVRLLPEPPKSVTPDKLADGVILNLHTPPPPPPVKLPEPKQPPTPVKVPTPVDATVEAKRVAKKALSASMDELSGLRALLKTEPLASAKPLNAKADGPARAERSLLTSNLSGGSEGINTAQTSSGFGGGTGSLKGHATMNGIRSFADGMKSNGEGARRAGAGGKAARSREEIELVFDRNKSLIYSAYSRALRSDPSLQGKVVVQLTILPDGEVTECRVLSSDLKNEELERKLVAIIKTFRFQSRDVELMTTTKPIDFFPG